VPDHPHLSVVQQCQLLGIARSSYYYQPQSISEEELTLLRLLDQQYLETPFYGSRRMMLALRQKGYCINRSSGTTSDAPVGEVYQESRSLYNAA
jgi:putative transposase